MRSSYVLEHQNMPKYILAFFVPAGMKLLPTLTMEIAIAAVLGWFAGLQAITISLIAVQVLAGFSSILTHGFTGGQAKNEILQGAHMWLVLAALAASGAANIFPVNPYPFTAGIFVAYKVFLILRNAHEHSGLKTSWLDGPLQAFLNKPPAATVSPNDALEKARQEYDKRNDTPIIVQIKDKP